MPQKLSAVTLNQQKMSMFFQREGRYRSVTIWMTCSHCRQTPVSPPKPPTNLEDPSKIKRVDGFTLSYLYTNLLSVFESAIADADRDYPEFIEGHSGQFPEMTRALHYLAGLDFVRTVCETGFNYGHSSFAYLTAKSDSKVHSFDLANHHYALVMTSFLNRIFPGRLFVHFGNSSYTIPEYIVGNPSFRCDLMLVDGGHDYDIAKSDLTHFVSVANPDNNVIMFDDYPTDWGTAIGRAWEEMIDSHKIKELLRCRKRYKTTESERGFVVGRVMK